MFFITGSTSRFVDGLTYFWTISFQEDWGVAEGNSFFGSYLLVFNETALDVGFFNHYYFVDTSLSSSGNGTNVKSDIIVTSTASLTGITNVIDGMVSMMMIIMVSVMTIMMSSLISGVEWESSTKVLSGTLAKCA